MVVVYYVEVTDYRLAVQARLDALKCHAMVMEGAAKPRNLERRLPGRERGIRSTVERK
jgi:hypothetical protein